MGWGYSTGVNLTRPDDTITIIRLRVNSRKDNQKELLSGIKEVLIAARNISKDIVENENKRQQATPMSILNRLSWAVDGIKDHEAMINADKIRNIMASVKPKDINDLIKEMLETKPATIITGDIS